jgi:hypothetical protein
MRTLWLTKLDVSTGVVWLNRDVLVGNLTCCLDKYRCATGMCNTAGEDDFLGRLAEITLYTL